MTAGIAIGLTLTAIGLLTACLALNFIYKGDSSPHGEDLWFASMFIIVVGLVITLTSWGIGLK